MASLSSLASAALARDVDPWSTHFSHVTAADVKAAYQYRYNLDSKAWGLEAISLVKETAPFSEGAMRQCFRMKLVERSTSIATVASSVGAGVKLESHANYVIKQYKSSKHGTRVPLLFRDDGTLADGVLAHPAVEVYTHDIHMQMVAKSVAAAYNKLQPPRPVDFLEASLILVPCADNAALADIYGCERFVAGDYVKHNSNAGFVGNASVSTDTLSSHIRNTPQAFSHFSYVHSGGSFIIVDVQGVGDLLTDPQIHTVDGQSFGVGNLGLYGIGLFFRTHICSHLCQALQLPMFELTHNEVAALRASLTVGDTVAAAAALRGDAWRDSRQFAESINAYTSEHPSIREAVLAMPPIEGAPIADPPPIAGVHFQVFAILLSEFEAAVGQGHSPPVSDMLFHLMISARLGDERARSLLSRIRATGEGARGLDGMDLLVATLMPLSLKDRLLRVVIVGGIAFGAWRLASAWFSARPRRG